MSADEFDPMVERLFSRVPALADEALFNARIQSKLETRSRWRGLALTGAGLVGGLIAVREGVNINFAAGQAETTTLSQGAQTAAAAAQRAAQSGLDGLGLTSIDLTSGSGMMTFWIVAGALVALLAAGAMRLSQDV